MRPLLLLLLASATAQETEAGDAQRYTAALTLPATAPLTAAEGQVVSYETQFLRPDKRYVVVGQAPQKDVLPPAGTDCPCDAPHLVCDIHRGGATLAWQGAARDWPLQGGHLGTCQTGDVTFDVEVTLTGATTKPWWRGPRELVVPVRPAARTARTASTKAPRGLPDDIATVDDLGCALTDDGATLSLTVPAAPTPGVYPCLRWHDGELNVRLVDAPR